MLLGQADNVNYKKVMNNLNKGDLETWDENQPSRLVYGESFCLFSELNSRIFFLVGFCMLDNPLR